MRESKELALRRMRRIATGTLLAAAVLCLLGSCFERIWHHNWSYLTAFAEAAMIGGLADWFAVVALFRHPLGIPLWHTAIVPQNKDRFGVALGNFVVDNFLTDEVVHPRLERIDLADRLAEWLGRNHELIAERVVRMLPHLLSALDDERMRAFIVRQIREQLQAVKAAPLTADALEVLTGEDKHKELLRRALRWVEDWITRNKATLSAEIAKEVPLPDFDILRPLRATVADYVGEKVVAKIGALVEELGDNPDHPLHGQFREFLDENIALLKRSPGMIEKGEKIKRNLMDTPETGIYLAAVWDELKKKLIADATSPASQFRQTLSSMVGRAADDIRGDTLLRGQINHWMRGALREAVSNNRLEAAALIAETVRKWDPQGTADRLEVEVGSDLQYIRINGAVIGGLAGLAIHFVSRMLT